MEKRQEFIDLCPPPPHPLSLSYCIPDPPTGIEHFLLASECLYPFLWRIHIISYHIINKLVSNDWGCQTVHLMCEVP